MPKSELVFDALWRGMKEIVYYKNGVYLRSDACIFLGSGRAYIGKHRGNTGVMASCCLRHYFSEALD